MMVTKIDFISRLRKLCFNEISTLCFSVFTLIAYAKSNNLGEKNHVAILLVNNIAFLSQNFLEHKENR